MSDRSSCELQGQLAVVTGASSGIGRAIARELAAAGAAVVVHARRSVEQGQAVVAEIEAAGGQAELLLADVGDPVQAARLVDDAWIWQGAVDVWINNAGADVLTGEAAAWPFERKLTELFRVDVAGTINIARLVGQRMRERRKGLILNVGWDQAEVGMAGDSGELFAASKGAVMAFTRSLARSLAPHVRVNCLAPGWIRTAWGNHASEYWQQRAQAESLLGRWGQPEDVARLARFLASPAASFINGQTLAVNGGF